MKETETKQENRYVGVYEYCGHEEVTEEDRALIALAKKKKRIAFEEQEKQKRSQ